MTRPFVHLHIRSDMSFPSPAAVGDYVGSARVSDYVTAAAAMGHTAIAFTELGSMRGMYEQIVQCKKAGLRPIYGCEFYVARDRTKKAIPKEEAEKIKAGLAPGQRREAIDQFAADHDYMRRDKDLTLLTLWAESDVGLRNMFRLLHESWSAESYYYKPRIDIELVAQHSAGIWCGTGGPNSYVNRPLTDGKRRESVNRLARLHEIFGERLRLEVRPQRILTQSEANAFAVEQSARTGIPLLATAAAHYLAPGDLRYQKMLASIGSRDSLDFAGLDFDGYWLRTGDEMVEGLIACGLSPELAALACDETIFVASQLQAEFNLDPFAMIIPEIETEGLDHNSYLRKLCEASPVWLEIPSSKLEVYRARMERELEALGRKVSEQNSITFASYSLYVREVMEIGRKLGIVFGPGRGSAAGSLVSWLIGITQIDPIAYDLSFERYLSPNRVGPPDIDVDCDPSMRAQLFAAMRERWGEHNVAQISTMGKLKGRAVVESVCRVLQIDLGMSRRAAKEIDQRQDYDLRPYSAATDAFLGYSKTNEETGEIEHVPPKKACLELNAAFPEVLEYASELEGKMRALGVHAGGVVAAPRPLYEYLPMETRLDPKTSERLYVTAFEKIGTEETGLLKIDMLGVITINTIALAMKLANETRIGLPPLTMESIPYDDQPTLDAFTAGDFAGVFQYDSQSAAKLCRGVTFAQFSIVADMTALNRPGPLDSGTATKYVDRQIGREPVEIDYCPEVSRILESTYGIMVYQEQIMRIFGEVAGHENPDEMRKIIGKKLRSKMEAERPKFVAGMAKNTGMSAEQVSRMFDDVAAFGRYAFNASHSVAYGRIGYLCQYLKVHYPLEWSLAIISTSDADKRRHFAKDASKRGVVLLPPDVSISGFTLSLDRERNAILGALSDIKGVGDKAATSIMAAQPFASFDDFMGRVDRRVVNAGVIEKLARAGALDRLLPNPRWFCENRVELFAAAGRKKWISWEHALAAGSDAPGWDESERALEAATVNPMSLESPYSKLISELAISPELDFSGEEFFAGNNGRGLWLAGSLVEIRVNQNVPFGGATASEADRGHRGYAAEFVSGSLEDQRGSRAKIKIPWYVYEHCKDAIAEGAPVLVFGVLDLQYQTIRANIVVDLEGMRNGSVSNIWTEIARGNSPRSMIKWPPGKESEYDQKISSKEYGPLLARLHSGEFRNLAIVGTVLDVQTKLAGKDKTEMAWLGVLTDDGSYAKITVFSSDWLGGWDRRARREKLAMANEIKPGTFARFTVRSDEFKGEKSCILDGTWKVYGKGKI